MDRLTAWGVLLLAVPLQAQTLELRLYSEFQRVGPFGEILAQDRAHKPREILSPAVVRNGFASFHVAVTAPAKSVFFLAVQSSPAGAVRSTVCEEKFVRHGEAWIPDRLREIRFPYFDVMPDPDAGIEGQTTRAYLLDLYIPPDAPDGVRVEVLAKTAYWVVAPLELRVVGRPAPDLAIAEPAEPLPPVEQPADAAVWSPLENYQEGGRPGSAPPLRTVRDAIRRNAVFDMALARQLESRRPRAEILKAIGAAAAARPAGAEWYLKVRDDLYREAARR